MDIPVLVRKIELWFLAVEIVLPSFYFDYLFWMLNKYIQFNTELVKYIVVTRNNFLFISTIIIGVKGRIIFKLYFEVVLHFKKNGQILANILVI